MNFDGNVVLKNSNIKMTKFPNGTGFVLTQLDEKGHGIEEVYGRGGDEPTVSRLHTATGVYTFNSRGRLLKPPVP